MVSLPGGERRESGSKGQNRENTHGWKKTLGHKEYVHNFITITVLQVHKHIKMCIVTYFKCV